jgi:hypothetical protein
MFTDVKEPWRVKPSCLERILTDIFRNCLFRAEKTGMETQKANLQSNCCKEGQVAAGVDFYSFIFVRDKKTIKTI